MIWFNYRYILRTRDQCGSIFHKTDKWQALVNAVLISFSRNTVLKIVVCFLIYVSVCWVRPYAILFKCCSSVTVDVMQWYVDSIFRWFYDASSAKYTVSDVWIGFRASVVMAKRSKSWDCLVVKTFRVFTLLKYVSVNTTNI